MLLPMTPSTLMKVNHGKTTTNMGSSSIGGHTLSLAGVTLVLMRPMLNGMSLSPPEIFCLTRMRYWWYLNQGPNASDQIYEYHLETYGPNVVYDDFIANFTASAWDPQEWVDLFASAGANYFVFVSKHHDGYAMFDLPSNVTNRTSVVLPPHRNLLSELFDAAAQYQPQLHRATYFSLPEWFHPDYQKYGFSKWPGGNATNPFTNQILPYTGYIHVNDFLADLMVPQMNTLASMGTEIMWCDVSLCILQLYQSTTHISNRSEDQT